MPCPKAGHNSSDKSLRHSGDKVMRNQSIVAGLVMSVTLVVTTNAQNHSSIGQSISAANGKSEHRMPKNRESAGTITSPAQTARLPFSLSKIDARMVKEFQKAW